jgi:hypothetical protein
MQALLPVMSYGLLFCNMHLLFLILEVQAWIALVLSVSSVVACNETKGMVKPQLRADILHVAFCKLADIFAFIIFCCIFDVSYNIN